MVKVKIYMEGGGDSSAQAGPLRDAARKWIERALPEARKKVQVVACGGRRKAYENFCTALEESNEAFCILLVDSEKDVDPKATRWKHVERRDGDGWKQPDGSNDDQLHFMSQVMETWLVADPEALATWFKGDFIARHLPGHPNLEKVSKDDIYSKLKAATRLSARGEYGKGQDFAVLGHVDPAKVLARCPHAALFVNTLRERV